jgi:hypothetical protein
VPNILDQPTSCSFLSDKWGSNPRPLAWEANILSTELLSRVLLDYFYINYKNST